MSTSLGLDIGGANIKIADSGEFAETVPFALWKYPDALVDQLRRAASKQFHLKRVAVTMTGELCDCYATKREGIARILEAVDTAFHGWHVCVINVYGELVTLQHALANYLTVAAANWRALSGWVGRTVATDDRALLIDIGSTTADIIPILDGVPFPIETSDLGRLRSSELIYTGVKRTPLCALLGDRAMAEFFATTEDAYVLLGKLPEKPESRETADGKPMTTPYAHYRIARMVGGDGELMSRRDTLGLALRVFQRQRQMIVNGILEVLQRSDVPLRKVILSGSGEFLARAAWDELANASERFAGVEVISLTELLGEARAEAACAFALAMLAREE